jgi:hypothetical protein
MRSDQAGEDRHEREAAEDHDRDVGRFAAALMKAKSVLTALPEPTGVLAT